MKIRKKPVVVEAEPWLGTNPAVIEAFCGSAIRGVLVVGQPFRVATPHGEQTARVGDWVIRGVQGEFYPIDPAIFAATYEPADGGDDDVL